MKTPINSPIARHLKTFALLVLVVAATAGFGSIAPPKKFGLLAYWPANHNANNISGPYNGVFIGDVDYQNGVIGKAFNFDGNGSFVGIGKSQRLGGKIHNGITIEFWMKASTNNALDSYQGLVASDFFGFEISNGFQPNVGLNFYVSSENGGSWGMVSEANGGGAPISAGVWHHVAGTYDGTTVLMYIDGQVWGNPVFYSGDISPMTENGFLAIGSEDGRAAFPDCIGTRYFNGLIDEVRIYDRALSAAEIQSIYEIR